MFFSSKLRPYAIAEITGNTKDNALRGMVYFYEMSGGTYVIVDIRNLPKEGTFHGFHIHTGESCGNGREGSHYNPKNQSHPNHAGDLPPLLANDGMAFSSFYTNRFYPEDIIGKVVVIHAMPDDFQTQPSGNAGDIIGCGKIIENHG